MKSRHKFKISSVKVGQIMLIVFCVVATLFNSILRGLFDQRILHWMEDQTPKPDAQEYQVQHAS